MSHTVIIKAMEYVVNDYLTYSMHLIFIVFTAQRQLFNSLAPILPSERQLIPWRQERSSERFFRFLMRADTFRFAISLDVGYGMNVALAREVLSKMDCAMYVSVVSRFVDDSLTATLMALPHLERVSASCRGHVTYLGTLRPLLKHPRESVRRSAASVAKDEVCFNTEWFSRLSNAEVIAALQYDIIPLIDSASCNAAVLDYLTLVEGVFAMRVVDLPNNVIILLGERLFQFFSAANSHPKLIDKSLRLLALLSSRTIVFQSIHGVSCNLVAVDVFKEWPVLELLPDMILFIHSFKCVIQVITCSEMERHRYRFFELGILDAMYDMFVAQTGNSPFALDGMRGRVELVSKNDVISFLKTGLMQKELQQFLLPWHRDVMAEVLRMKRRGEHVVGERGQLLIPDDWLDRNHYFTRTPGMFFIVDDLLRWVLERCDPTELCHVTRQLFDEHDGLNIGPVLRSYVMIELRSSSHRNVFVQRFLSRCRHVVSLDEHKGLVGSQQRRPRENCECTQEARSYLSEFLNSLKCR